MKYEVNHDCEFAMDEWVELVSGLWAGRNGRVCGYQPVDWGDGGVYWVRIGFFRTVFAISSQLRRYEPGYPP